MGFIVHLVAYVGLNVVFLLLWAAGGEADRSIGDALSSPLDALRDDGFWPLWVLTGWGALLAIHGAVALKLRQLRLRRRRRERAIRRSEARAAVRAGRDPGPLLDQGEGRRWLVALFTDVVGSTGLAEALGDDEWHAVVLEHRRLVRSVIAEHGGTEVGTQGDGFLVRFDDPCDGVRCAIALQRRFEADREAGGFSPPVRIGLHAGEVVGAEGDLVGRMVNIAARVTSVGRAGEIIVTEPVADQLGPDVVLHDHGLHALRGIERPRHLLTVEWRVEPPMPDVPLGDHGPDRLQA